MKEIKAYVRDTMASRVVEALVAAGCRDFSILDVRGVVSGLAAENYQYSVQLADAYERIAKFEIVCRDEDANALIDVIRLAASTGRDGDGMVFLAPIEDAIRVRDGRRGENALVR